MKVLLLYPEFPDTYWGLRHALHFIRKKASVPPLGLLTVASLLPGDWEKRLVDMNVTRLTQDDLEWADYVFISAMTVQRNSVREVLALCKQLGVKVVAGGPLFTMEYEEFPEVDHLVLNEGELTVPAFLHDLEQGSPQRLYQSDQYADMTTSPVPMWELVDMRQYSTMEIQYSRGCPFSCDFCNITSMLGHRFRTKTAEQIVAELDMLYNLGWRGAVFFVDDNLIGNKGKLKREILPALIELRRGKRGFPFFTQASINLADDPELMQMMTEAGFNTVFVGIETPDENSLLECHKVQNKGRDLLESVKRLQRAGLQVQGGFIVGFDSDTPSIFQRQAEFIQQSGIVSAMVGLLNAPKGTKLYERLAQEGRLEGELSGDNTDYSINFKPKMDPEVLQEGYQTLIKSIYEPRPYYERIRTFLREYKPMANVRWAPDLQYILAFLRSIVVLGIKSKERVEYWKLLLWTLFRRPRLFADAVTLAIYGFHFRRVFEIS